MQITGDNHNLLNGKPLLELTLGMEGYKEVHHGLYLVAIHYAGGIIETHPLFKVPMQITGDNHKFFLLNGLIKQIYRKFLFTTFVSLRHPLLKDKGSPNDGSSGIGWNNSFWWFASLYVLLNLLDGDNGAFFFPAAERAFSASCYSAALLFVILHFPVPIQNRPSQGKKVSCLGTFYLTIHWAVCQTSNYF